MWTGTESSKMTADKPASAASGRPRRPSLADLATALAAVSAAGAFLALFSAWSFGRGFALELGLPSSIVSFSASLEQFPAVGLAYSGSFLLTLGLGATVPLLRPPRPPIAATIIALSTGGLVIVGVASTFEPRTIVFRLPLTLAAMLGPLLLGATPVVITHRHLRLILPPLMLSLVLQLYSVHLYYFGHEEASALKATTTLAATERGMAASRSDEFPLISFLSSRPLPLRLAPTEQEAALWYEAKPPSVLRLVLSDTDRYYVLETVAGRSQIVGVAKTEIVAIRFHGLSAP
jgi:hypothetical protein